MKYPIIVILLASILLASGAVGMNMETTPVKNLNQEFVAAMVGAHEESPVVVFYNPTSACQCSRLSVWSNGSQVHDHIGTWHENGTLMVAAVGIVVPVEDLNSSTVTFMKDGNWTTMTQQDIVRNGLITPPGGSVRNIKQDTRFKCLGLNDIER